MTGGDIGAHANTLGRDLGIESTNIGRATDPCIASRLEKPGYRLVIGPGIEGFRRFRTIPRKIADICSGGKNQPVKALQATVSEIIIDIVALQRGQCCQCRRSGFTARQDGDIVPFLLEVECGITADQARTPDNQSFH